jgi:hypothetical protein
MMACFDDAPANEREYVARIAALVKPAPKAIDRLTPERIARWREMFGRGDWSDYPSDKAGEIAE